MFTIEFNKDNVLINPPEMKYGRTGYLTVTSDKPLDELSDYFKSWAQTKNIFYFSSETGRLTVQIGKGETW